MRVAEWKRTARPLLPADQDWGFRASLSYRIPVHRVLLGVLGEGSSFDKGVYIWRVTMPMFVPSDVVDLSWSERIGGGARKYDEFDKEALANAIATASEGLRGEEEALNEIVARYTPSSPDLRLHEVVGYAQTLLGDVAAAKEPLDRAASGEAKATWEQDIIERANLVRRLLDEKGLDEAISQLDEWSNHTAGALGLRRSPSP
jgi:hypothetical protein